MANLLYPNGPLSRHLIDHGILNAGDLQTYIGALPYGRNADRAKPELVLSEKMGTCSSKHALVKMVAMEQNWSHVELILGIYKMNEDNTPGIGNALHVEGLDYLPEAHCYLNWAGKRLDLTFPGETGFGLEGDLLHEEKILPFQVAVYKVERHQEFIENWIEAQGISFSPEEIWDIREGCIRRLSK